MSVSTTRLCLLGLALMLCSATAQKTSKGHPIVLLPGFASGRLRTWRDAYCKAEIAGMELGGSGAMFAVGDSVWVHTPMIVGQRACFLRCMRLVNGTDPVPGGDGMGACKVRADEGLDAISRLDPGIITGPLTDVWWSFIQRVANELDVAPEDGMVATPYDWRLDPQALQYRDNFFTKLRHTIEEQVLKRPGHVDCAMHPKQCPGVVLVAHSMGNNVFRYFCEWLESDMGTLHYRHWLDRYIYLFVGVGAPWMGAAEGIRSMFSGNTFGLPISTNEAREMGSSFGSGFLMMPTAVPDEEEGVNAMVNLKFDNPKGDKLYSAKHFADGPKGPLGLLKELGDEVGTRYYESGLKNQADPAVNIFYAPKRLPLKRVICAYGVNRATEAGYHYTFDESLKRPILEEVTYEQAISEDQPLEWQQGLPDDLKYKSGDGTVNYASLAWCKRWLGPVANVTLIPDGAVLKSNGTIRAKDVSIKAFSKEHAGEPSNTYWESDVERDDGERQYTQVWEFENVEHRETIKSPPFLREFVALLTSAQNEVIETMANDKDSDEIGGIEKRRAQGGAQLEPATDAECMWDYSLMECALQDFCNYDYHFGDLTLSQSCRLRASEPSNPELEHAELEECVCKSQCVEGFCKYMGQCVGGAPTFGPSNGFWGPCMVLQVDEAEQESAGAETTKDATESSGNTEIDMLKGQIQACATQMQNKKCSPRACTGAGDERPGFMCFDQSKVVVFGVILVGVLMMAISPLAIFNADDK